MSNLTIVIVTANTRAITLACLATLPAGEHDIVVVDNGSRDETAAAISGARPDVTLVALEQPVGFAAACNRGARLARSAFVLFLNSDIAAKPDAVALLVDALDDRSPAVAAGGRLVDPGTDTTQLAYRPRTFPTVRSLCVQLLGIARLWPGNPITRRHLGGELSDTVTTAVDQPAGACLVVRRTALECIGGLDEGYWFWFEDVDLCRRLHDLGPLLYVPSARFEHHGGESFKQWSRAQVVRSRHHGLTRYVRTHFAWWQRTAVALVLGPVLAARALLADRETRRAYAGALRSLPALVRALEQQAQAR